MLTFCENVDFSVISHDEALPSFSHGGWVNILEGFSTIGLCEVSIMPWGFRLVVFFSLLVTSGATCAKSQIFTKLVRSDGHLNKPTFDLYECPCQMELTRG